jgi:sodium/proline symporter
LKLEWTILAGLLFYMTVMLVVGLFSSRYIKTLDDFVLAGRRLGPWVAALSERASGESAWFLLGLPGAAYGMGFTEYWSVIGIAGGILLSWTLIAIPLRRQTAKLGALTIPDYLELRFKDRTRILRIISMTVILFFYTVYISAQLSGAGKILHATFGLDPRSGIVIGAIIIVFYTLLGGFLAVAWTDFIQGIMMLAVALILPIVGLIKIGGPGALIEKISSRGPAFVEMAGGPGFIAAHGGKLSAAVAFGVAVGGLSWGMGYLGQPHLLTRYMAIRKTNELPKAGLIAMGWTLLAYWGAPMIGIVGLAVLGPDLADPEQVMPLLAKALLPGWLAGLMIAGAIAAMMSTADSQLLVITSTLVEDIYIRLINPATPPRLSVLLSRVTTFVVAVIALMLAFMTLSGANLINTMVAYAWTGLGASFGPPILFSLWWRGTTRAGVLAGMIGGMLSTVVWQNSSQLNAALDLKAAAVLISAALVLGVSLLTRQPSQEM